MTTNNQSTSNTQQTREPDSAAVAEKFLTTEFQQSWGYQQHIESQMVSHLRFYVTLLLGVISAAIAISKFGTAPDLPTVGLVSLLFLGFWFIGQIFRTVYLELRIRKMLAIEDLNSIREYFTGRSPIVSEYSSFPTHRTKSPPFLRKGSAEWYSLIFMASMNSLSLATCLYLTDHQWEWASFKLSPVHGPILIWIFCVLIFCALFVWEFRFSTLHAYKYDLKRRQQIGPSQYDLLNLQDRPIYERVLIKLSEYFERRYDNKLGVQKNKHRHKGIFLA